MKKQTNTTRHDKTNLTPPIARSNTAAAPGPLSAHPVFRLGLDVDLQTVVMAVQCDQGQIPPAQKFFRPRLRAWIQEQLAAGPRVHTVYECCGFGCTLHEKLTAAAAHSLVTTPMRLSLERRRKNDRLDARELGVRLARYLDGHTHELRPIRIPSWAEQQRRERRVRLCYWKQWQRPRTRRRHLIALGIHPSEVMKASRCRRGYWWMSGNGIVQRALNNVSLWEQGVPDLKAQWIELHYGGTQAPLMDIASVNLTGTA